MTSLPNTPPWLRRLQALATLAVIALAACGGGGSDPAPPLVPTPDGPRIESFEASRSSLPIGGGSVALSWRVSGADSVRIDQQVGTVAAASSVNVDLRRNTRYTLTATRGAHSSIASVVVRVVAAPLSYTVDESLAPTQRIVRPDGSELPLAASQDANGVISTFVADELIVAAASAAELDAMLQRHGATVVGDDAVPEPPTELGITLSAEDRQPTYTVIRLSPSSASLDRFIVDAQAAGLGGAFRFSSMDAARLVAIATAEQAAGHAVRLNHASQPHAVLNATVECAAGANCPADAFTQDAFKATGSRADVLGAWQLIAGGSTQRRVRLAVIDGGFWINPATGLPNTAPGVGHDYPALLGQYDFDSDRPRVGAVNPNRCTGGADCNWHGNGAAGVALGVVNNGQGAAGTGGQVSGAMLFHVRNTEAQEGRAIRTARAWGADVVSMSFGAPCNSACDFSKFWSDPRGNAVEQARRAGVVIVASAGNDNHTDVNNVDYEPCTLDGVICVGALANNLNTSIGYSNVGAAVDIWAPTNILSMYAASGSPMLTSFGGTSASAPFIAGIAAMMKAVNPGLSSDQVRDMLRSTAWTDSPDAAVTHYVNAQAAVRAAAGNRLHDDALEAPGSVLAPGRVDELSIHSATDRDEYRFTVGTRSRLYLNYEYASGLGRLRPELRLVQGCGAPSATVSGATAAPPSSSFFNVSDLPPGDYALSFVATVSDTSLSRELTAYLVDWRVEPTAEPFYLRDGFEPNNSPAQAALLTDGNGGSANLDTLTDVDHYRVRGGALSTEGSLTLDSYFSIPRSDAPLRLTLLTASGAQTGISAQSDPNCSEPLGLHVPEGDFIVRVESLIPTVATYEVRYGRGIAGVFVPHAPLRWEARRGLPFSSVLNDPAIDHLYLPDGQAQLVQLLADGVAIALVDVNGNVIETGIAIPGFDGTVLPLDKAVAGGVYFIELTATGLADPAATGRLPGRAYSLSIQ